MACYVLRFRAVAFCGVLLMAACSAGTPENSPLAGPQRIIAASARSTASTSWMDHAAARAKKLYYVSDPDQGVVHVYDYRTGARVGRLANFWHPEGQCVDARGDVFVANMSDQQVDEFGHARVRPKQVLKLEGLPVACSVSPSGDLAVADAAGSGQEAVAVFRGAEGTPKYYKNSGCYYVASVAYDADNNLYVEGLTYDGYGYTAICELPHGGTEMRTVTANVTIEEPAGAMWDGQHITLADRDYDNGSGAETAIYRMQEDASGNLTSIGQTILTRDDCGHDARVAQPFLVGKVNTPANNQLATEVAGGSDECVASNFWAYPAGGTPSRSFKGPDDPTGDSVSIRP
jgi:hypothetical protein